MLDDLKYQRDVITLESSSGAVALEHAVGRLPDFFSNIRTAFNTYLAEPAVRLLTPSNAYSMKLFSDNKSYVDLRKMEAYVPPGLSVDYLTYTEVLKDGAKQMQTIRQDVLTPFSAWLASKLGNPSSLAALTVNLKIDGVHLHSVEKLEKRIQSCFNPNVKQESLTTYGAVVRRNADWVLLQKDMEHLNSAFSPDQHREIVELVNRCTSQIDTLMRRMEEEPDVYKISPPAVAALANMCYQIARELEFYGMLRNRIKELSHAIDTTSQKLTA